MATYEIMPPVAFFPFSVSTGQPFVASWPTCGVPTPFVVAWPEVATTIVVAPAVFWWFYLLGVPQQIRSVPDALWRIYQDGRALPTEIVKQYHAIPGVTTIEDEWPDNYRPQMRVNAHAAVPPPMFVLMYHGEPGVLRGDDNWSQENPSYQPQLRLNTLPHTADPTIVDGTWRVNEVFLPSAGA
jgi:hypothetical protein